MTIPLRRILWCQHGFPGRWNDKTVVTRDHFLTRLHRGAILSEIVNEIKVKAPDNTVATVRVRGVYVLSDNGYLAWACTIPPCPSCMTVWEKAYSDWVEAMRKNVECFFGIMKLRSV